MGPLLKLRRKVAVLVVLVVVGRSRVDVVKMEVKRRGAWTFRAFCEMSRDVRAAAAANF